MYFQKEINFINNALGSSSESQMWLEEAQNAGLIDQQTFERLDNEAVEVRKMLVAMIRKNQIGNRGKQEGGIRKRHENCLKSYVASFFYLNLVNRRSFGIKVKKTDSITKSYEARLYLQ